MLTSCHRELEQFLRHRKIDPARRLALNAQIHRHLISNSEHISHPNFSTISDADLGLLFQITDELFFDGRVGQLCESVACRPLAFRLSTRMTISGGTTTMSTRGRGRKRQREFEIAIATTPLFATFPNLHASGAGPATRPAASLVGGLPCRDRVEALQRIMEHEMVHLIEMLLWDDSNCSGAPFKRIVRHFFGHTESNHRMLTPTDLARQRLGIQPGDHVSFDHRGRKISGLVNRITKRATVLVPDPAGRAYTDGSRYATYYVPLNRLRKTAG